MMIRKFAFMAGIVSGTVLLLGHANPAAAQAYKVDAVHSSVVFRIKHANTSYAYGRFNDITGHVMIDDANLSKGSLDFVVKTDSIDTANPNRDKHLKTADFFNAVQFPTITFKSKSIAKAGPDAYQVSGDLTLHGVTHPQTIKLVRTGAGKDMKGKAIVGYETDFSIKRSDFKMNKMLEGVSDEVKVIVSIEAGQ